jgi:hypothetical protein
MRVTCKHKLFCRVRFWLTRTSILAMMWLTNKIIRHVLPRKHPSAVLLNGALTQARVSWKTALGPKAAVAAYDPND